MKTFIGFIICLGSCWACTAPSTAVVSAEPPPPVVVVRPAAPYPRAVWVGDEWRWRRGRYVYVRPHYVKPRHGRAWVDGHWKNTPRGLVWIRGHWR